MRHPDPLFNFLPTLECDHIIQNLGIVAKKQTGGPDRPISMDDA